MGTVTTPRTPEELLEQVRATAEGFTVFGELGRRSDRDIWYLARDEAARRLVALRLRAEPTDAGGDPSYSLEVATELGKEVPLGDGNCPHCRAELRTFARFCGQCGGDLTTESRMPRSAEERAELLESVRIASSDVYDVVGEMPWGSGAALVYFALEKGTGRLVRLRLKPEGDEFSLGETRAAMALKTRVLAAYTTGHAPVIPQRPGPVPSPPVRSAPPAGRRVISLRIWLLAGGVVLLAITAYLLLPR